MVNTLKVLIQAHTHWVSLLLLMLYRRPFIPIRGHKMGSYYDPHSSTILGENRGLEKEAYNVITLLSFFSVPGYLPFLGPNMHSTKGKAYCALKWVKYPYFLPPWTLPRILQQSSRIVHSRTISPSPSQHTELDYQAITNLSFKID